MCPPLEQLPNNEERYFIPMESIVQGAEIYVQLRSRATVAINDYFQLTRLGELSLDHIVSSCLSLLAVRAYIDHEEKDHAGITNELFNQRQLAAKMRERNIKVHISLKIKEYIDGKL